MLHPTAANPEYKRAALSVSRLHLYCETVVLSSSQFLDAPNIGSYMIDSLSFFGDPTSEQRETSHAA
jgi:hypothetical protein